MAQNIGTLITAAIRPNDSLDPIASAFANEIKGGLHSVTSSSDRDAIIEDRRSWSMLVNVINDSKTYELKYNYVNTTITDNNNWVQYSPGGNNTSEWLDSVLYLSNTPVPPLLNGDRYLVDNGGAGLFTGHDGKIAVFNAGTSNFDFSVPTNVQTLRVDTIKNILFKFQGTYGSGGVWVKEYLNQVKYLSLTGNGLDYGATSSSQNTIDSYSFSVFYCDFDNPNTGTVSVSIDTLPYTEVKKLENNVFNSLVSGDIQTGIKYQLILNDSGFFQTILPSSTTTTIGNAEDGNYTDGLFTDFTTSTPIGTAVDRFNEILKALVPPSAPDLSSLSATGSFVSGGLSFDNSTSGSLVTATSSPYGAVSKGGLFSNSSSPYRLGITSRFIQPQTGTTFYQDITGILNSNVLQSTQTPVPVYITFSFGNGLTGSVSLVLNGFTISTVGLTGGAINTTNSGATSGLVISAATSSLFPSGTPFDRFQNRTGTYLIKKENSNIVNGYNYLIVRHDTPTTNYVLNRYEWVADNSTASVTSTSPQITNVNAPSTKYISGIQYYTTVSMNYSSTLNNLFSNTFNTSNSAITYRDVSSLSPTNNVTNTTTNSASGTIFSPSNNSTPLIPNGVIDPTSIMLASMTFSVSQSKRRINDDIAFAVTVRRTVQGTFSGATSSSGPRTNWFIDTYPVTSSTFSESFDDESYRLKYLKAWSKYNYYHTISQLTGNTWSSLDSLYSNGDNDNGLQVINGILVYPKFDFTSAGTSTTTNPNFGFGAGRNYANCLNLTPLIGYGTSSSSGQTTTNRTYLRWFYFGGTPVIGSVFNFTKAKLNISYHSTSFINSNQQLSGNNLWIEVKLPYGSGTPTGGTQSSGSVTGWMDLTKAFTAGQYSDGSGCLEGTLPTTSNQDWLINFGVQGTEYSNGYVLLRITAPSSWTGYVTSIQLLGRV